MLITKIQKFCTRDGPGVRTTVFFKGCPLSCKWCHNPETQSPERQIFYTAESCIGCRACGSCPKGCHTFQNGIHKFHPSECNGCGICAEVCPTGACEECARDMSIDGIMDEIIRDRAFYGQNGGVTLSGGEPLIRSEAVEILKKCRDLGIGTAIETCGYVDMERALSAAEYTDLFLWDIKDGDAGRHFANTGVYPEKIRENLLAVDKTGKSKIVLRCIIIRGVNDDENNFEYIADIYSRLLNCEGVELIPYHAYGGSKARQLGYADNGHAEWIPGNCDMLRASEYLSARGVVLIPHE